MKKRFILPLGLILLFNITFILLYGVSEPSLVFSSAVGLVIGYVIGGLIDYVENKNTDDQTACHKVGFTKILYIFSIVITIVCLIWLYFTGHLILFGIIIYPLYGVGFILISTLIGYLLDKIFCKNG